jgi:(p)ppGpp synthase/HD superfamily hydrolase
MSTLERAIAIAAEAHAGQTDKAGQPYILHPLRVMMQMDTDEERIVAVLHDVVEDCEGWSFDRLMNEGFNSALVWSIAALTRKKGEAYNDFIARCSEGERSRKVKIADIRDNLDPRRLALLPKPDPERVAKYQVALALLTASDTNASKETR